MSEATALVALAILLAAPTAAIGQTPPPMETTGAESLLCDPAQPSRPRAEAPYTEVRQLVREATQAMILGELVEAAWLLDRALEWDPYAPEATYLRGRIAAEEQGAPAAVIWFCRYLAVSPDDPSADEARRRLEEALGEGVARPIRLAFAEGIAALREGKPEVAIDRFGSVLDEREVPEALFNRGLARIRLGRDGAAEADLMRYLELRPESPQRSTVEGLVLQLHTSSSRAPGKAFPLGAVLPGAGQFYTRRPAWGVLVSGLVGGAVAAGLVYERTTIHCTAPAPSGACPPDAVARQEVDQPLLVPSIGVAGTVMLLSALEAALHARRRTSLPDATDGRSLRFEIGPRSGLPAPPADLVWVALRY